MTQQEFRKKFLDFFIKKEHKIIPSAPLVPENDPTVLFTTAGMHSLVPYLLGQPHPLGRRICNIQKCLRTDDIDEIGDDSHLTFFEMMGNWSLGDYFKKEAIEWSFEFLTKELKISKEKLAISVFEGKDNIEKDEESAKIWLDLGISEKRIVYLGMADNWWGPAGKTGPCGPDTEMFYWTGETPVPEKFDPEDNKWLEIWNDVFMQYNKTEKGEFIPLKQKNVDTGMGLERMLLVLNNKQNIFETELFQPLIKKIQSFASSQDDKAERIIADHLKTAVFTLSEKVEPSNIERGYVLRRLIRRAIRYAKLLGIEEEFLIEIAKIIIKIYEDVYPELEKNQEFIFEQLRKEEECFKKTLERGLREFNKLAKDNIKGKTAFDLYQTYGFPIEIIKDLAKERDLEVDEKGFEQELKKHQELSRGASAGKFKSGLADSSAETIKYHTATHLLHAALREVLGDNVKQMGSNITPERLRFDFSFDNKMTDKEIKEVEDIINQNIKEDLPVIKKETPLQEALESGALSFFRERYPDRVNVYSVLGKKDKGVFSKEICSGPHVERTSELGKFKIIKEESVARGIRRIRAVLE